MVSKSSKHAFHVATGRKGARDLRIKTLSTEDLYESYAYVAIMMYGSAKNEKYDICCNQVS